MPRISDLTTLARKLRGRSRAELVTRAAQIGAAALERGGLRPLDIGAPERTLARRLASAAPGDPRALRATLRASLVAVAPVFGERAATVAALRAGWPDDEGSVRARAESVLAGRFDLLGYRDLSFGTPIDWHLDPVHGRRAPRVHWRRVPYLDFGTVGDHKVVWELNRHQFLLPLAQAYWYSGEERFAEAVRSLVSAWMDENPPKQGINWASSLEVAFRAISWIWALGYCLGSPALDDAFVARLLAFADVHGRHLETYLSTYFAPNTHLTGEALALTLLGHAFPVLRAAARWRTRGDTILRAQRAIHIRPDGTYFEQSTQYHRYTTEFYLLWALLAPAGSDERAARRATVERLMEFAMHLTRPDGTIPLIGDDDGGRILPLDGAPPDDVRSLLTTGAAFLGRGDLKFVGHDQGAAATWLLGPDAARTLAGLAASPPAAGSRAFPDGGVFVMRDGWAPTASQAVIDCGPHGVLNGVHAHADALSLTLALRGRDLLVDPGTLTYPDADRNVFRGPAAHNVVLVDGAGASEPSPMPFRWTRTADGVARTWRPGGWYDLFTGTVAPASSDAPAGLPTRTVVRLAHAWIVRDELALAGAHTVTWRWHLAPGLDASPLAPGVLVVRDADGRAVCLLAAVGADGDWTLAPARVSPQYGVAVAATVCQFVTPGAGDRRLTTVILPLPDDGDPWRCRLTSAGAVLAELYGPAAGGAGSTEWDRRGDVLVELGAGDEPVVAYAGSGTADAGFDTILAWGGRSVALPGGEVVAPASLPETSPAGAAPPCWRADRGADGWRITMGAAADVPVAAASRARA